MARGIGGVRGAHTGAACRVPRFSDFPVLKSVFSIDGGAIGVGI